MKVPLAMSNIADKGSARWQNAAFAPPPEDTLREIVSKMHYNWDRGVVAWVEGRKPYNTSRDGLPGTIRKDGYRYVKLGRTFIPISRIAYYLIHDKWPKGIVRFVDGDPQKFKHDNLVDSGDTQNPLAHSALMQVKAETTRRRQEVFEEARAANQAADGLYFFEYEYDVHVMRATTSIKVAKYGSLRALPDEQEAEYRAEAIKRVERVNMPRDAVDYQLKRMGITPPADTVAAFKLLQVMS